MTVTQITGTSGEEAGGEDAPEPSVKPYTVIESDRGTIYFVPIVEGKMGKDVLTEIAGKEAYVNFQKKDAAENVLYAWEFHGMDLTGAEDLVFTLDAGTTAFSGCPYGSASDTLYISFTEDGPLPAEASLYLRVAEYFTDGAALNLYSYGEDGELRLLADEISAENGYVAAKLATRGNLILTAQNLEPTAAEDTNAPEEPEQTAAPEDPNDSPAEQDGASPAVIAAVVIAAVLVLAAIAVSVVVVYRRKKKSERICR